MGLDLISVVTEVKGIKEGEYVTQSVSVSFIRVNC